MWKNVSDALKYIFNAELKSFLLFLPSIIYCIADNMSMIYRSRVNTGYYWCLSQFLNVYGQRQSLLCLVCRSGNVEIICDQLNVMRVDVRDNDDYKQVI